MAVEGVWRSRDSFPYGREKRRCIDGIESEEHNIIVKALKFQGRWKRTIVGRDDLVSTIVYTVKGPGSCSNPLFPCFAPRHGLMRTYLAWLQSP